MLQRREKRERETVRWSEPVKEGKTDKRDTERGEQWKGAILQRPQHTDLRSAKHLKICLNISPRILVVFCVHVYKVTVHFSGSFVRAKHVPERSAGLPHRM